MDYRGKKTLVVGMARSGVGAAQLLCKAGAQVTVNDSKKREELKTDLSPLDTLPVTWALGQGAEALLDGTDVLVISPGIPDTAPFVQKARAMGVYVIGEVELASQLAPGMLVAITGTNGKTTTTTLTAEMFRASGKKSFAVGNIGESYAAAGLVSRAEDVMVCEISSFQMETADTFHPKAAAFLNLTEDHLNRHGTMEVYAAMKMRVFQNQTPDDVAVFNADDPALEKLIPQVKAQVMLFSRKREVEQGAFVRNGMVTVRWQGREETVCPAAEIRIPGPHNLENALAAVCLACSMGVKAETLAQTLRSFAGVEHRIEYVRTLRGVRYINDSKGTNVDSTIRAVQTMTRPTVIILGGSDKHCDFTPLVKEMLASPMMREAVVLGVTADQIEDTLRRHGFTAIRRAHSMEEAVQLCQNDARDGWNVLLSPACASFDMFSDYEERGRVFKRLVNELK